MTRTRFNELKRKHKNDDIGEILKYIEALEKRLVLLQLIVEKLEKTTVKKETTSDESRD